MSRAELGPIRRSAFVRCSPEHAFDVYTAQLDEWWPKATHSLGEAQTIRVEMEPHAGGRIYEVNAQGEAIWGTIVTWDPPRLIAHTWHPGRPDGQATVVEVRFDAEGDGVRVTIEHRDWHTLGLEAARLHLHYSGRDAWPLILKVFAERTEVPA